mgnify:FL=1
MDELHMLHNFINEFWQLIKKHPNVAPEEDTDKYWADYTEEVSALCKKYDNHPAVIQTLCGYSRYLEAEGSGRNRDERS